MCLIPTVEDVNSKKKEKEKTSFVSIPITTTNRTAEYKVGVQEFTLKGSGLLFLPLTLMMTPSQLVRKAKNSMETLFVIGDSVCLSKANEIIFTFFLFERMYSFVIITKFYCNLTTFFVLLFRFLFFTFLQKNASLR